MIEQSRNRRVEIVRDRWTNYRFEPILCQQDLYAFLGPVAAPQIHQ